MTEQQYTYLDTEGFRHYSNRDEWEIRMEKEISVRPQEVWEVWFTAIWEGQDDPIMLDPGKGRGRLGRARTVRCAGMTERIVSVGVPFPASQPDGVPSISYSL